MRTNGLTDYIKKNFIEKTSSIVCPNFTAAVVEKSHKKAPEATWLEFTSKEFRAAALPQSWLGHYGPVGELAGADEEDWGANSWVGFKKETIYLWKEEYL